MMKLKLIAIFRLKMDMKKMKEASRQMKATHPQVFWKLEGIYFLFVVIPR